MTRSIQIGEPQGWELAEALLRQIRSYRCAARFLRLTDEEIAAAIPDIDAEERENMREDCRRRLAQPVVDVERARQDAADIEDGWGFFTDSEQPL